MYDKTEKSCLDMVQEKQLALTGNSDGWKWDEFERDVVIWAKPRYGASHAIGLWCNQLREASWLDLEVEEDFNTFKVECKKVYGIIAHENEPCATVVYGKEMFLDEEVARRLAT